jgi:DNA repair protein RadD
MISLRDYQQRDVSLLEQAYQACYKAPLYVLPTGGGKTYLFCYIAEGTQRHGGKVLILEHRNSLVDQASDSLKNLGVDHGVISPRHTKQYHKSVQVASVQTLIRRMNSKDFSFEPTLIIVDEGHHAIASTWRKILDRFPHAVVLGVTATPIAPKGQSLADIYDVLIEGTTAKELIEAGHLCEYQIYAPKAMLDLSMIKTRNGDYDPDLLTQYLKDTSIIGDSVEAYRKYAHNTPALAFCVSIKHAEETVQAFNDAGYRFALLTGKQDYFTQKRLIKALATGDLHGLASVDVISEGTDIPVATTAIFLRPTQSKRFHLQAMGRVLRPHKSKQFAIVLDHVGNVMRHGVPDMDHGWALNHMEEKPKTKKQLKEEKYIDVKSCPACFFVFPSGNTCPSCGYTIEAQEREVNRQDGELIAMDTTHLKRAIAQANTMTDFVAIAKLQGYKTGWAFHQYQAKKISKEAEAFEAMLNKGVVNV